MERSASRHSSSGESKLTDALAFGIEQLIESHSCSICHEILNAPVRLPCAHVFCSLCIRRHLSRCSTCPHPTCPTSCTTVDVFSLRRYDAALSNLRKLHRTPIPTPIRNHFPALPLPGNLSRAALVKKLSSAGLETSGSLEVLQNRYREFVLRVNAASDSAFGAPKHKVLDAVRQYEAALSQPQRALNVFSGRPNSETVAQQGDSFDELVRKVKRRKRVHTRAAAATDSASPYCKGAAKYIKAFEGGVKEEENKDENRHPCLPQKTNTCRKRPISSVGLGDVPQKSVDGTIPKLSPSHATFTEVAVKSLEVNIEPTEHSSRPTPPSAQELTQVTPTLESGLHLTREQMERISRNKMAAMERRRRDSQKYVRRLPFTGTGDTSI